MKNKKQIIICIVIAIIIFVIGAKVGAKIEYSVLKERAAQTNTNDNKSSSNATNQEEKNKFINLNQNEKFKGVELKVLKAKEEDSVSNEGGKTKASGKFVVIEISMKNTSKEAIEYSPRDFQLLNNGTKYQYDDNSFETLQNIISQKTIYDKDKNYAGPYDKFNPGITKKIYAVFDVPKDLNLKDTKLIAEGNEDIQFNLTK